MIEKAKSGFKFFLKQTQSVVQVLGQFQLSRSLTLRFSRILRFRFGIFLMVIHSICNIWDTRT